MAEGVNASELSVEAKRMYIESAARSMEELVARLKGDKEFSMELAKDPRTTLERADISLEKEAMELLIATDPDRFDKVCDELFEVLDPNTLSALVAPSCDGKMIPSAGARHELKFIPKKL